MTTEKKVLAFEQMLELIQNLVERIEALEKTVREKQQPQPLEGELMSVDDVCKLLGKSKSAIYRTVKCQDMPYIRQGNRLYFDRPKKRDGEGSSGVFLYYYDERCGGSQYGIDHSSLQRGTRKSSGAGYLRHQYILVIATAYG